MLEASSGHADKGCQMLALMITVASTIVIELTLSLVILLEITVSIAVLLSTALA